jgi:hypothetical protein
LNFALAAAGLIGYVFEYVHTLAEDRTGLLLQPLRTRVFWCGEAEPLSSIAFSPKESQPTAGSPVSSGFERFRSGFVDLPQVAT